MDREGWYHRVLYGTESDDFKLLSGGRSDRHRFKVGGSQILVCVWLIDIYVLYSKAEKKVWVFVWLYVSRLAYSPWRLWSVVDFVLRSYWDALHNTGMALNHMGTFRLLMTDLGNYGLLSCRSYERQMQGHSSVFTSASHLAAELNMFNFKIESLHCWLNILYFWVYW